MNAGRAFAVVLAAGCVVGACAQILSYDDYQPRLLDAGGDAVAIDEADVDAPPPPAWPPPRPDGPATPSGTGKTMWLAVKHYSLGSEDADRKEADDAWKLWGFDLDHVCTSLSDSIQNIGTCRRATDARQEFLLDGARCRDNNFGQHVIALVRTYSSGFEARLNEGIYEGNNTWIIRVDDVDATDDDTYAPAKMYRSADTGKGNLPKWDGTDVRAILSDSVVSGSLEKPITEFPNAYIKGNVWVSGEPATKQLVVPVTGDLFVTMTIEGALLTMELDKDRVAAHRGMVGGALPMASIETIVKPIAENAGFCPGTALYQSVLKSISRFPDLVIGAPNLQDVNKTCDGLSIGLGFEPAPIQPVTQLLAPPPPPPTKCDDAGV